MGALTSCGAGGGTLLGSAVGAVFAASMSEAALERLGGTVVFEGNGEWFAPPPGPQRELLVRLKNAFDPDNRLTPLPWR